MLSPNRDRHADAIGSSNLYHLRQLIFLLKMVAGMAGQSPEVRTAGPRALSRIGTWRQA